MCLSLVYWKGRALKTETAELLALIYKGWRKSGRPSVPIIFPIYILRWSPGSSNRKPTRTKAAVRYGNYGSGSERGNRYIAESRPVLLFQRRTDSFLCSFTPSRPSVMHCVTLPTILSQPPDLLAKQVPASIPYRYTYVYNLSYALLPRDILRSTMKTRIIHVLCPRYFSLLHVTKRPASTRSKKVTSTIPTLPSQSNTNAIWLPPNGQFHKQTIRPLSLVCQFGL